MNSQRIEKVKLKPFSVSQNGMILGEVIKAKDLNDLLENRLSKKAKENWSLIQFVDSEDRSISIRREFLDEGMSIEQIIEDWILSGDINEPIQALNPKKPFLVDLK